MTIYRQPARRPVQLLLAGLLVAAIALGYQSTASSSRATSTQHSDKSNLDPALLHAYRQAKRDAANSGVELAIKSGWRSPEHQQRLLDKAVATYGSEEEARRWVATPETSPHVAGDAIDIDTAGTAWLSANGAAYGLCQIYANEPWHYELRSEAASEGCPQMYPDPTYDPRMQP